MNNRAALYFASFSVVYYLLTCNSLEINENMGFRFDIDPLILILIVVGIQWMINWVLKRNRQV
jgi:hypothetical protein